MDAYKLSPFCRKKRHAKATYNGEERTKRLVHSNRVRKNTCHVRIKNDDVRSGGTFLSIFSANGSGKVVFVLHLTDFVTALFSFHN